MIFHEQSIPVKLVGLEERCCRIVTTIKQIVPPLSEIVVEVFVEHIPDSVAKEQMSLVVEAAPDASDSFGLVVAPCLIDSDDVTSNIRLLNPNPFPITIFPNQVLALGEQLQDEPQVLLESENADKADDFSSVRRILLDVDHETVPSSVTDPCVLPPHLEPLNESLSEIRKEDKAKVCQLLVKFQDVFSKDEYDLGLCTLLEHCIETGDAKPIKQPPRKVPLAFADEGFK